MADVKRRRAVAWLSSAAAAVLGCPKGNARAPESGNGDTGSFTVAVPAVLGQRRLNVFFYRPAAAKADTPIVVVMHGEGRNADAYRDAWIAHADALGAVVVSPECSRDLFRGSRQYPQGWVLDDNGQVRPRERWSFHVIDAAFDAAVRRFGSRRTRYLLYGHSAGSQFVHRFMLLTEAERVERAVAANAGWYTLPVTDQAYPYGVRGVSVGEAERRAYFGKPLIVLLGGRDTDTQQRSLSRTPAAMLQGPHRLARGQNFFEVSRREAARLGAPFNWRTDTVAGVAHSNAGMAGPAARLLLA